MVSVVCINNMLRIDTYLLIAVNVHNSELYWFGRIDSANLKMAYFYRHVIK